VACRNNAACVAFASCTDSCTDQACYESCATAHPAAQTTAVDLLDCGNTYCSTTCVN
jgi:hypothetical protein